MENANATATLVNQVIVLRVHVIPVLAVIVAADIMQKLMLSGCC